MRRAQRLRSSGEFARVRRTGRAWRHRFCVLVALPSPENGPTRVGFSVGRRVGGAVVRNRLRRRLAESVRLRYADLAPGWDIVVIARPCAADVPYRELDEALGSLLRSAGLLRAET